jgi:hypothetical protein
MPEERIAALEQKIDAIYTSVEKTRRYILTTLIITVAVVVLPVIGLLFAVPSFMSSYNDTLKSLDLEGL